MPRHFGLYKLLLNQEKKINTWQTQAYLLLNPKLT